MARRFRRMVMQRTPFTGNAGITGWLADPDDLEAYRETVAAHWGLWSYLWSFMRPVVTEKRIAYTRKDGGLSIVTPDPVFFILLRRGGVIRHMRIVDEAGPRRVPVFEGTGEIMPSMTESEAIDFLAWKDVPRGVNHIAIVDDVPADRSRRAAWQLTDDGRIRVAA